MCRRVTIGNDGRCGSHGVGFSGLSALNIEDVEDAGDVIGVRARTPGGLVACPSCGVTTGRVHRYHERIAADTPVGGRRVLVNVRVRRLRCPVLDCKMQTFREQVPGVLERYQRRTMRLTGQGQRGRPQISGPDSSALVLGGLINEYERAA